MTTFKIGHGTLLLLMAQVVSSHAQTASDTWTFIDAARDDREIPVQFFYPNDAVAPMPWVIIAHGFAMSTTDYDDLAQALVAGGFVVGLVNTETGFAPSHEAYGLDLAYLAEHGGADLALVDIEVGNWMQPGTVALVGHSMGGGAAWLAASMTEVDALVGLAPAETTPSAIEAGPSIEAPAMVISGTADAVTPPTTQHIPLYEALTHVDCQAFVSLEEGGHCGFADEGTLCDFGELLFTGMDRETQQLHTHAMLIPWLQFQLGLNPDGLDAIEAYADNEGDVELTLACETSSLATGEAAENPAILFPNPVSTTLNLGGAPQDWRAWNAQGQAMPIPGEGRVDVSTWPNGPYLFQSGDSQPTRVLVTH